MPDLFQVQNGLFLVISVVCLVVKAFAMIDCASRRPGAFGHTMSKNSWLILLGIALVAHLIFPSPLALFNLLGTVAALVYLAQHRGSKVL